MSIQVKAIEPDKSCKACMAAQRTLESSRYVLSKAVKKIKEQAQIIEAQIIEAHNKRNPQMSEPSLEEQMQEKVHKHLAQEITRGLERKFGNMTAHLDKAQVWQEEIETLIEGLRKTIRYDNEE